MTGYVPPYEVTEKIFNRIASISEKAESISSRLDRADREAAIREERLRSVHASLCIEANPLTLEQVKQAIDENVMDGKKTEVREAVNANEAYERLPEIDPYDLNQLQEIHRLMTRSLIEEAGRFRKGEEGVFSGDVCVFMAPPAKFVSGLMSDLFSWMNRIRKTVHPLIISSVFHYEFVFIHPFSDGNGRMARLWQKAILDQWLPVFDIVPVESQIEKCREEYYSAIAKCHSEGSSTRFIEFMLDRIYEALNEVQSARQSL